jgi:hypothetical protein
MRSRVLAATGLLGLALGFPASPAAQTREPSRPAERPQPLERAIKKK